MSLITCLRCMGHGEVFSPASGKMIMCKVCLGTREVESDPDDERDDEFQELDDFSNEVGPEEDTEARHWANHATYLERHDDPLDEEEDY